jgi:hypothetical protein
MMKKNKKMKTGYKNHGLNTDQTRNVSEFRPCFIRGSGLCGDCALSGHLSHRRVGSEGTQTQENDERIPNSSHPFPSNPKRPQAFPNDAKRPQRIPRRSQSFV